MVKGEDDMKVFVLVSTNTKSNYFKLDEKPKCLLDIGNGTTILDYQMGFYQKYGFDVHLIVGYKCNDILEYCIDKNYKVESIYDDGWEDEYNFGEFLLKNYEQMRGGCLIIFGDLLFKEDVIEYLLSANSDICRVTNDNAFKFSSAGMEAWKFLIEKYGEEHSWFSRPTFRKLSEVGVSVETSPPLWQYDVDNREELNTARMMMEKRV